VPGKCQIIPHIDFKKNQNMADTKRHRVVSYENMNEALADTFNEKYPHGFNDFLPDLVKYTKPDGTPFYAVTLELPDAVYLVKIKVQTDDADDVNRWLEGQEDAENEQVAGPSGDAPTDNDTIPDDNISQYEQSGDDSGE